MISRRRFCVLGALSGIAGVAMLMLSFAAAVGPPAGATSADMVKFGQEHFAAILWGAWLQAVGPVFIIVFALALVHLAGAMHRLAGWMTLFGSTVLMTVSLIEITFYMSAMFPDPPLMPFISMRVINAVQHLYFNVAAPSLFFPLGIVLVSSRILPQLFGYLAIILAVIFAGLGVIFLLSLTLPAAVTAFAGIQAIWWLAAAFTLAIRSKKLGQVHLDA
jgi:hypothetical protein